MLVAPGNDAGGKHRPHPWQGFQGELVGRVEVDGRAGCAARMCWCGRGSAGRRRLLALRLAHCGNDELFTVDCPTSKVDCRKVGAFDSASRSLHDVMNTRSIGNCDHPWLGHSPNHVKDKMRPRLTGGLATNGYLRRGRAR